MDRLGASFIIIGIFVLMAALSKGSAGGAFLAVAIVGIGIVILCANKKAQEQQLKQEIEEKRQQQKKTEAKQKFLATKSGLEKLYEINNDEVAAHREGIVAMRQLGMVMEQSVYQEKEHNWAIHGGIAQGIAGPVAGVANAYRVMQENERIRAENASRREWGAQQRALMNALAEEASQNAPRPMSIYQINHEYAAIFSWSPLSLFEKILIFNEQHSRDSETGTITVKASWKEKDPSVCVDGSIRAKIYNDSGKCVGCAYLVLPKSGTIGKTGTLSGLCTDIPYSQSYSVKFEPIDLWELTVKRYADLKTPDNLTQEQHEAIVKDLAEKYSREIA